MALTVRRYVQSDIVKILELARQACASASIPYAAERLKFVLDNNLNNSFFCCLVLVDLAEVVGVLVATVGKSILNDNSIAEDGLLYVNPAYDSNDVKLIKDDYVDWARERGCTEARANNLFLPDLEFEEGNPRYSVAVEVI